MTDSNPDIDEVQTVFAGKFRRYHGESWLSRLFDIKTNLLNLRDLFYFAIGTVQALFLIKKLQPDTVLLKGGFVGVPVGLASVFWRIPFVTHDSDAVPGLANRLVARWATYHATAMPAEVYSYPKEKVKHVGVLVGADYEPVSQATQRAFKHAIGVPVDDEVLLVTGGSSGAEKLNHAVRSFIEKLLDDRQNLYVVHQVGKGKTGVYEGFTHKRLRVEELLFPLYEYTGASDVVVTRAGANALAELGVQGRACIIVPSAYLTGGHQIKNARILKEQDAALVVDDTTIEQVASGLEAVIRELLENPKRRRALGAKIQHITIPDATQKLTMLLLELAKSRTEHDS